MLAEIPVSEESAVINTVLRQKLGFLPKSNIYSVFKEGPWGQQTRKDKFVDAHCRCISTSDFVTGVPEKFHNIFYVKKIKH